MNVKFWGYQSSELSETPRLYCSWDAVLLRYRQEGLDVGLINKSTPNLVGEHTLRKIGSSSFMLVIESLNRKTAVRSRPCSAGLHLRPTFQLSSKMGTYGAPVHIVCLHGYDQGPGGLSEQIPHQNWPSMFALNLVLMVACLHRSLHYQLSNYKMKHIL